MKNLLTSASKIPLTEVQIAWLSTEGWTTEQLLFVAEHGEKLGISINLLGEKEHTSVVKAMKVHKRLENIIGGINVEYDPKNKLQRADTPSWFGKSFDRNLFK